MILFAKRDSEGRILSVSSECLDGYEVVPSEEAMLIFKKLYPAAVKTQMTRELHESDNEMIRVIEDVIELLIAKNLIQFTELPRAVQQKIFNRKKIRRLLSDTMIPDDNIDI